MNRINKLKLKKINSFARKRSSNKKSEFLKLHELLPVYSVLVPEDGGVVEKVADVFHGSKSNFNNFFFEIGFGKGENLLHIAKLYPENGFIGCEVFQSGVVSVLQGIEELNISNVRIWYSDAIDLLIRLPNNSISRLYVLHPDPWPKKRHHKRRLINDEFLQIAYNKLIEGGMLIMASDDPLYQEAIEELIAKSSSFFTHDNNFDPQTILTEYGKKAGKKGLITKYYNMQKI